MHTIIYKSLIRPRISEMDLNNIRILSEFKNRHYGVTGCLYFSHPCVIQLLQGSVESLLTLYGNIFCDRRHYDVCLLMNQDHHVALFPSWSMKGVSVEQGEAVGEFVKVFNGVDPYHLIESLMRIALLASDD